MVILSKMQLTANWDHSAHCVKVAIWLHLFMERKIERKHWC